MRAVDHDEAVHLIGNADGRDSRARESAPGDRRAHRGGAEHCRDERYERGFSGRRPAGRGQHAAQGKPVFLADMQTAGLEVEPLEMRAAGIRANGQNRIERIADVDDLDVAAVEVGADVERRFGHGHNRFLNMIFMAVTLHAGRAETAKIEINFR